jgi:methanogenic corrinoid protein MtbC1
MHDLVTGTLHDLAWAEGLLSPAAEGREPGPCRSPTHRALAATIEREIVPRLLLAHCRPIRPALRPAIVPPSEAEVTEITALMLHDETARARDFAEAILGRGVDLAALLLDLLAPAARRMGEMWVEDTADFAAVSIGVWRLHQLMRDLSAGTPETLAAPPRERRILLTTLPAEQHGFGVAMLAGFFRRAGWEVLSGPIETRQDLLALVRGRWFAVIGLSLSWSARVDALATTIRAIRRASQNPNLGVMVGGSLFNERPELVRLVGADATAPDARAAPVQAARLVALLAGRD